MVVTNMLSNVLDWTYRLLQQYKSREQLLTAYHLLQQSVFEAERKQQAEQIKALQLEKELQIHRERLGRDLHDGLGSQLTHLISRLDILVYLGNPDVNQLVRLCEFAREMNQTLRETIWLLDRGTVTLETFGSRLHGILLKIGEDREVPELRWQLRNSPDNPVLSPLIALHLIRITQEATNNALKYAIATQVSVNLAVDKTNLLLTITDNGQGFDARTTSKGFGLTNMRKRTEEVKGNFNLQTSRSGTKIRVIIPLNT
ncbi:hypothetical protein AHMF7605_21440 [Adhaeribacter arboris]|uniref:histidine kinase n=1 Tax=Adhaeribacter arboris TaxID=2072846 RepID=A0A2T2YK51_9BACT|nr:ATP-binding protein [Adhaeribacter arboris]PSR55880.1 hypothetical protein AHMF7605_21440 [Adhaeribacter arboris]